jgi:cytosine/creatinine deaminase
MDGHYFTVESCLCDPLFNVLAYLPTTSLTRLAQPQFWQRLSDADYMRIAVLLAQKSYHEGGCPIGAVVIDNVDRRILGKGHNTLVQENDPYNHGETAAMRDAGSIDFGQTTLFTTLTPCNVCACLLIERGLSRLVIGNCPNSVNNEKQLQEHGICVERLEDPVGIELYARYQIEKPELDIIDWKGVAELRRRRDQ